MNIWLIIPSYNESSRVPNVIKSAIEFVDSVVAVDDGSTDATYSTLQQQFKNEKRVHVLRHEINLGKGAALKTGSEYAISKGAQILIYMDADGQHKSKDIPRFLEAHKLKNASIVFGSREIGRDMPLVMMLGNKFLSIASAMLFGVYVSDTQSGFRLLSADAYHKLKWTSSNYAVETEMISKIKKSKLTFSEITIDTIYNDNHKGTTVIDGIRIFLKMLKWKIL